MPQLSVRFFAAALLLAAALESCNCQRQTAIDTLIPEGQACESDDRCETGLCDAVNGEEKKCLRSCTIGCKQNELCTTLSEGRLACVQERAGLCKACTQDSDCPQRADRCIVVGETSVCGRDCAQQECPNSYVCGSATSVTGELVAKQCVPMSGTCDCVAASAGQQVACSVANDAGTCLGVKICTPPDGYSACNARTPGGETCNGIDDDCDGQTDEGLADLVCGVGACARTQAACLGGETQTCTPGMPGMETCNGLDDDCDGVIDNPAFLSTDPNNCGACGAACTLANAIPGCFGGMCTISQCVSNYADCNGTVGDGCEVNLGTDVNNCQTCGHQCTAANATSTCSAGNCAYTCDAVHYDINGLAADGCEYLCVKQNGGVEVCNGIDDDCDGTADEDFDKQTDINNCGTCNTHCTALNGTPVCNSGTCGIGTCNQGFKNCDNVVANGCETNIFDDTDNCGVCGFTCNAAGGQTACSGGVCGISCGPGFADCNSSAADGCEKNIYTDNSNCGGCGVACTPAHATGSCQAGNCGIGSCAPGWADCNNNPSDGCEVNLNADPTHCGSCNTTCNGNNGSATCNNGACGINCTGGYGDCNSNPADGCEVNLNTDATHCGSCVVACSTSNGTATCSSGSCGINCNSGFANCNNNAADGCEVNTNTSTSNCGGCGTTCTANNGTPVCNNGGCGIASCNLGYANCNGAYSDGCEINTTNNTSNCSACNAACNVSNGTPVCNNSTCGVAACTGTWRDCDSQYGNGCEIDTGNNVNNCGGCGVACSAAGATGYSCTSSTCGITSCQVGLANCDNTFSNGCEVNLTNNVNHCGACGNACNLANATSTCSSSSCAITACTGAFRNCDSVASNGCESNSNTDVNNCGGCGTACNLPNAVNACSSGSCTFTCPANRWDIDGNPANGCEYACTFTSATDYPDLGLVDSNCDGIDGEVANSIFVATNGNDGNVGTMSSPKLTIAAALSAAVTNGKRDVLVAGGSYLGQASITAANKGLYGGYTVATPSWSRALTTTVTLTGTNTPLSIANANNAIVQLMTFNGANPSGTSISAYGALIVNSSSVQLQRVSITAGAGTAGSNGSNGSNGASGNPGGQGTPGCEDSSGFCSSCSQPGPGGGGSSSCGRTGGAGGTSAKDSNTGGAGGTGVGGTAGGLGVPSGWGNWAASASNTQYWGSAGANGTTGANGTSGGAFGSMGSAGYIISNTTDGTDGTDGNGGGGGGGGGGGTADCNSYGAGGSGGGGGGCKGTRGTRGTSGGGSFGVMLWNSSAQGTNCTITASVGGKGGNGGAGGSPGTGGNGGAQNAYGGGSEQDDGSNGGPGGKGGNGGAGGAGGAGGGGPSVGVARGGTSTWSSSASTVTAGTAGAGGTSNAGNGATGTAVSVY